MHKISALAPALCALLAVSCATGALENGIVSIWGGDAAAPKMTALEVQSSTRLNVSFTAPVSVIRAGVLLQDNPDAGIPVVWESGTGADTVIFILAEGVALGVSAAISATVADARGDTLSFVLPFTGFNDRVARLRINEIRTEYSKPKVEYIEFYVAGPGNIGGIEIYNAMNPTDRTYEFPAVEVAAGEYIVYHLRSVEEGLVDETGAMDASAGVDARPLARDFWDNLTSAPLKKTNAILVRERKGGAILDAFMCAESGKTAWPGDSARLAAEEAAAAGAWSPGSRVEDAFCSTGTTVTRTMGRSPDSTDTGTANDWKISGTSKCTPGATNSPW